MINVFAVFTGNVKRKLRRQTEEMVYCPVQGLIYKLGLMKSQTLTEGN